MAENNNIFDFDEDGINSNTEDTDLWTIDDDTFDSSLSDSFGIDIDGDGTVDIFFSDYDINGDGINDIHVISEDFDGDGIIDASTYDVDIDSDTAADFRFSDADFDVDGESDFSELRYASRGEDGQTDEYYINVEDSDFDGAFDNVNYGVDSYTEGIIAPPVDEAEPYSNDDIVPTNTEDSTDEGLLTFDLDGDGFEESVISEYDFDGDGTTDAAAIFSDSDGDGAIDTVITGEDTDGDGLVDVISSSADIDGDGYIDVSETRQISYDEDGNSAHYFSRATVLDGDGSADTVEEGVEYYDSEGNLISEPDSEPYAEPVVYSEDEVPTEVPENTDSTGLLSEEAVDMDGDGVAESAVSRYDLDSDGVADAVLITSDTDGDGMVDTIVTGEDTDGDGLVDVTTLSEDLDGDGYTDVSEIRQISYDEDGNSAQYFTRGTDLDGDGTVDTVEEGVEYYDSEGNLISEPESESYAEPVVYSEDEVPTEVPESSDSTGLLSEEAVDMDGDGVAESVVSRYDLDSDGTADAVAITSDVDGDGMVDAIVTGKDTDGDGLVDVTTSSEDIDGDGYTDVSEIRQISYDQYGNSTEHFTRSTDINGDGTVDTVEEGVEYYDSEGNLISEPGTEPSPGSSDSDGSIYLPTLDYDTTDDNGVRIQSLDHFDPEDAGSEDIFGNPEDSCGFWEYQGSTGRCAVYSQKFVIEEITGEEINIEELVDIAEENDWFTEEGGTPLEHMDKLLDYYNIPNDASFENSVDDLIESLEDGNKIIVAVDSDEYWYAENDTVYSPFDGPNHAVEVIGVDNSDPDNPVVILNDPGVPNGAGLEVPMETFLDAWEDSNNYMIECY